MPSEPPQKCRIPHCKPTFGRGASCRVLQRATTTAANCPHHHQHSNEKQRFASCELPDLTWIKTWQPLRMGPIAKGSWTVLSFRWRELSCFGISLTRRRRMETYHTMIENLPAPKLQGVRVQQIATLRVQAEAEAQRPYFPWAIIHHPHL